MRSTQWAFTTCTFAIVLVSLACRSKELTRDKAEVLLREAYRENLVAQGRLSPRLAKKPEFSLRTNKQFMRTSIVVTGVVKGSESAAYADWHFVYDDANRSDIQAWLIAMDKLQKRLKEYSKSMGFSPWGYRDPTDGEDFSASGGLGISTSIERTPQWEELQALKELMSDLQAKGRTEGKASRTSFLLYDDGWRVVKH